MGVQSLNQNKAIHNKRKVVQVQFMFELCEALVGNHPKILRHLDLFACLELCNCLNNNGKVSLVECGQMLICKLEEDGLPNEHDVISDSLHCF